MNLDRLVEIRKDKDLNQETIAKVIGTSQRQYSKYELGFQKISIERLNILADFYNTSIDYLVGRTDERKPYPKSILR